MSDVRSEACAGGLFFIIRDIHNCDDVTIKIAREIYRVPVDLHYYSPVEALYLPVETKSLPFEVNSSTFESYCSLSVEAKDKLATIESKCRSLVKANRSFVKSIGFAVLLGEI